MKVICAGSIKTGTKSLHNALEVLGYKVYDFPDHNYYLRNEWNKVMEGNATTEDFYQMYKDVDAGIDLPFFYYWKEILEAFPDAKIILTMRDSEEDWVKSVQKQEEVFESKWIFKFLLNLSSYGRECIRQANKEHRILFGKEPLFSGKPFNKPLYLQHYRRHNAYVLQCAPKEQLLVYNVKEGWEPLCNFLEKPVPSTPFPHLNVQGKLLDVESVNNSPAMLKLKRETLKSVIAFTCLFVAGTSIAIYQYMS